MTSTFASYTLIARDLTTALKRKAADPTIARETAYYNANIGKVKSIDDLLGDQRLYAYAMKAYGLEDMTYAKAFMRKVLEEGVSSSTSFANRLADARYVAFARAFDFATGASANGTNPTYNLDNGATVAATAATLTGNVRLADAMDFSGTHETSFTISSQVDATTTKSATIILNESTLRSSVADIKRVTPTELVAAINAQIAASGEANLKGKVEVGLGLNNTLFLRTAAYNSLGADGQPGGTGLAADTLYTAGGKNRTLAVRNVPLSSTDKTAVDVGFGTALSPDAQAKTVTDAYLRQSLETDAGVEDTGLRLALYFARMAPTVTSAYDILGDSALSQVVSTLIGLPESSGVTSSDALARRAATIAKKIDIASLQDPDQVTVLVKRFAAIWDAQNANSDTSPILALFTAGAS
ncbi:DUF1217 domain-containing protein [Methylobacterium sp. ID0610]|uniref:DUF1217 domain-containing protein n=1 Tax=Methylobacterium carpenticola TaxID=3344827 RepID=UPI003691B3BC